MQTALPSTLPWTLALGCTLMAASTASAGTVTLQALRDNTLYEGAPHSNGAGEFLIVGVNNLQEARRALIAFDVASAIPAGSVIQSVSLSLTNSLTIVGPFDVSLHRVTQGWGEGGSNAPTLPGIGAPAMPGDATWVHRFFDTDLWAAEGGDFHAGPSATSPVGTEGVYTWGSSAGLVADVQAWIDHPASNFGWILIGDESAFPTAKRFDSRESAEPDARPVLTVEYQEAVAAGRVPAGLTVLLLPGGSIELNWGASCRGTDTDYVVYEGTIGSFASHVPRLCSTDGSTLVSLTPSSGDTYYLVVPRNAGREGSYGLTSDGLERPASAAACLPQDIAACP